MPRQRLHIGAIDPRDSQPGVHRSILSIVLLIALFALIGIGIIASGYRGRAVACDAVCAKCGYDLRGYTNQTRCSECGSDLHMTGAVRTNTLRVDRKKIIVGLLVIAFPWTVMGTAALVDFAKPRLRTNRSLITDIDQWGNHGPLLWNELARRLASGRLRDEEAATAVDQFIAYLQHDYFGNGSFFWSEPFYVAADRAGVITPAQRLQIARIFYRPIRISLNGLEAASPSEMHINARLGAELPGTYRVITVEEISMSGASATAHEIMRRPEQGTMLPPNINLLTPNPYILSASHVPAGQYNLKCIFQINLMQSPGNSTISQTPPPPGTVPLAQWVETVTMPVQCP